MKFSVVVPVYNVEKYLKECIESLINQTYKEDFEIILVDDGSSDNSPQICDEYAEKDKRIKVIHKENGGLVSARKIGGNAATGEYIICVDSDDWVELNYLENVANVANTGDIDIICCEMIQTDKITEKHVRLSIREGYYDLNDIAAYIYPYLIKDAEGRNFNNSLCTMAIKRQLYLKYQNFVDDQICMGEDVAVVKPCVCAANTLYIIKKPFYYYRNNPISITRSSKVFQLQEPKLRGKHFEKTMDLDKSDFRYQVYRMVCNSLFHVLVSQFNRKEKYSVIARDIRQTLKDEYYQCAISNCEFKYFNGKLTLFALKHRTILLIWLFNKTKKRKGL